MGCRDKVLVAGELCKPKKLGVMDRMEYNIARASIPPRHPLPPFHGLG